MERLTYDFPLGDCHCWQVKGADNLTCREVCENQGENGCDGCPLKKAFDRLAAYEDAGLKPEEIMGLCSMHERAKMADLLRLEEYQSLCSINSLRELIQAEKDERLVVHGQWITWEEAENFIPSPDRYECSVCHDAAQTLCNGVDLLSPYCPNCGAKMDLLESDAEKEGGNDEID